MFPLSIRMHVVTFLLVFALSEAYAQDRKISSVLNPGCKGCLDRHTTLVYIKATGSHDSIHQIWDFTESIPTVIFAVGSINSTLNITWHYDTPLKFNLSEVPQYSFAAVIDKLVEYDDLPDNGRMDPSVPHKDYSFRYMSWWRKNNSILNSDKEAMVTMTGHFEGGPKGTVELKLDLLPFKDFASDLPHLIHTANSTLVDVSLVNLTASARYNASRFALHFVLVSTDNATDTMRYDMRKSLDDEHTPGVFEIVEIKTPESSRSGAGGFLQFRPVAYNQKERSVTTSTNAHVSDFNKCNLPEPSTVRRFYSGFPRARLLVQDMYVSFGETGDGYYRQHNYTSWSFTIGYGAPPLEGFSLFVIVILCVGLGVPVALALSGVAIVLVRRRRARNNPTRFTDED